MPLSDDLDRLLAMGRSTPLSTPSERPMTDIPEPHQAVASAANPPVDPPSLIKEKAHEAVDTLLAVGGYASAQAVLALIRDYDRLRLDAKVPSNGTIDAEAFAAELRLQGASEAEIEDTIHEDFDPSAPSSPMVQRVMDRFHKRVEEERAKRSMPDGGTQERG